MYVIITGYSLKEIFGNEIQKLDMLMCKQILDVMKFTNNIKGLSELGRTPFKVDIATKILKYLQRF